MLNDMTSLPENLQIDMEKPKKDRLEIPKLVPFFQFLLPFQLRYEKEK